jgi:hypothetical protein
MTLALLLALASLIQDTSGTITGRVLFPNGAPAVGLRVRVVAVTEVRGTPVNTALIPRPIQTDSNGSYLLAGIPPGRYHVVAERDASRAYYPGATTQNDAQIIVVNARQTVQGLNFYFVDPPGFTISGRFVPPPPSPSTVSLIRSGRQLVQGTVATDGTFSLSGIPRGGGGLELRSPAGPAVNVGPVILTDNIQVLVISGRVDVEGGYPFASGISVPNGFRPSVEASGPTVPVRPIFQQDGTWSEIRPDGSFTLVLSEGEYRIGVRNFPLGQRLRSLTSGDLDLRTTSLKVPSPSALTEIRGLLAMEVPGGVRVSGKLTGLDSADLANIPIRLIGGAPDRALATTVTKADGTFEFQNVPPGTYGVSNLQVDGRRAGGRPRTIIFVPNLWWVTVGAEDVHGIDFPGRVLAGFADGPLRVVEPDRIPRVSGRLDVIDQAGTARPVPAGVMLRLSNGLTAIRPDGTFSVPVPSLPGPQDTHAIALPGLPAGYATKSMTYGTADLTKAPFLHDSTTPAHEIRITLEITP